MNVELPYKIGTVFKTTRNGKVEYDRINHYIVGRKIKVVLELSYQKDKWLSDPMFLEQLESKWEIEEK